MRRPLRRRDPLSASASVGNSVVRNRLVRPAKKSSTTTTEPADRVDDVEEATRPPARLVRPSSSKGKSTTPKSVVTSTPKSAFVRPSRRPSNRKPSFAAPSPVITSSGNFTRPANFGNSDKKYKIVCYFTNWAQYRPKTGKYLPEDIDPFLCTHIIYAFGWLKKGKLSSLEANDESVDGKVGLYERMMALKSVNPELKVLLALGGWTFGTAKFKEMSATRYSRQTFVFSAIPFLRQHGFDGLDLDWEYPKGSDDKRNFVSLLKGTSQCARFTVMPSINRALSVCLLLLLVLLVVEIKRTARGVRSGIARVQASAPVALGGRARWTGQHQRRLRRASCGQLPRLH